VRGKLGRVFYTSASVKVVCPGQFFVQGSDLKATLAIVASLFLSTCSQLPSTLSQILISGELRVVTLNSPGTYYLGAEGPQGPEYDLCAHFAADLGVALHIYSVRNITEVRAEVSSGRAHIAAAGLATEQTAPLDAAYGPVYQRVKEHLIFRNGNERPRDLRDAINHGYMEVATNSPHAATMQRLRLLDPELSWAENPEAETDELLYRLSRREFEFTIADSNEFAIGRSFHPDIAIALDINQGKSLAWLVNKHDASLLSRVTSFFSVIESDGRLHKLLANYYDNAQRYTTPALKAREFIDNVRARLPLYEDWFKEVATEVGIDWRLLAAIGYQESKWEPDATSFTGVRGLMMLTEDTARSLGIADRLDPKQSITGGAKYFLTVRKLIPARIKEPDRTWFALGCYNMGFGHIEDARILTQTFGKDPDKWANVRQYLPLLTQERYYANAKRGYARGWEPVQFVDNIKLYISMMDWVGAEGGLAQKIEQMEADDMSDDDDQTSSSGNDK